jgi:hypothetical protein
MKRTPNYARKINCNKGKNESEAIRLPRGRMRSNDVNVYSNVLVTKHERKALAVYT